MLRDIVIALTAVTVPVAGTLTILWLSALARARRAEALAAVLDEPLTPAG